MIDDDGNNSLPTESTPANDEETMSELGNNPIVQSKTWLEVCNEKS
jgi:hypothetical protein